MMGNLTGNILSIEELEELQPGALVGTYTGSFYLKTNMIRLFVDLHSGVVDTPKYIGDVWLIQDGPNHVISTMLEGWEE